ncbi:MAG: hypothetical protein ABL998_04090 [Planctomycetota bacterium]
MPRPLALTLLLAAACHAPRDSAATDSAPQLEEPIVCLAQAELPMTAPTYTLVQIKTGPQSGKLSKEDNDRAFAGHFANMGRMAEARELLVAGPYGAHRHDPALRGLFLLATGERAEAERLASTDPTTQAGVFVLEYHELATDAPLAAALERALAWQAAELAAGRTPAPAEGARPYVLLTAEHGDLAVREFAQLRSAEGGVYLLAGLDGTRALVLLDAPDLATAEERFAPQLAAIGAHHLDEWFASAELAAMVGP